MIINKSTSYLATQSMEKEQRIKELKSKCWDIVVKKRVDLVYLRDCIKYRRDEARECYNNQMRVGYKLTEEEFNTLKEGLDE